MSDASASVAAGTFVDGVYVFPLRVYYEDTDATGVVHNANYLKFAARARTEMLRHLGVDLSHLLADDGVVFTVRHCSADYLRPAHLDDLLEIHTRVRAVKGASLEAEQTVRRDGADLVRLRVRLACVSASWRPARLPAALRSRLEALCNDEERG